MVSEAYARAYKEVIEILKYTKKTDLNKIPEEKILMWETNMDKNWEFTVDTSKKLEEQNILAETRAIIANIFYDYMATDYQKQRIDEKDKMYAEKEELERREKYNPDSIFKNNHKVLENSIEDEQEEKAIAIIQEEKWYKKIINIIKKLFRKK